MLRLTAAAAIAMTLIVSVSGCGGGSSREIPDTVSVSGTVTLKGKPLAGADVNFVSPNGDFTGYGQTDENGAFTLVQGAVAGTNKVYISKIEGADVEMNEEEGLDSGQMEAMLVGEEDKKGKKAATGPKNAVPEIYSDPEKTKLTFEVPAEGSDKADFKL